MCLWQISEQKTEQSDNFEYVHTLTLLQKYACSLAMGKLI